MADEPLDEAGAGTGVRGGRARGRWLYRAFFAASVLTAAVIVVFYAIGLGDGTVSSFNLAPWLGLLAATAASLGAGHALRVRGRTGWALLALAVTAVPGLLMVLFVLVLLVVQPRWN